MYLHTHPAMNIPRRYCLLLRKSLYGLKQSPRNWNLYFLNSLRPSAWNAVNCKVVNCKVVDDVVLTYVKSLINRQFKIKDIGLRAELLNIRITQSSKRITSEQELYIRSLLFKCHHYIGSRNYADVPSLTEYFSRDVYHLQLQPSSVNL